VFKKIYVQYWLSLTLTNFSRLVVYYCLLRDCNIEFENKKLKGNIKYKRLKIKAITLKLIKWQSGQEIRVTVFPLRV